MKQPTLLLSEDHVKQSFDSNLQMALQLVEKAFWMRKNSEVLLPDKISQIFDEEKQNRINCMPGTLLPEKTCGVKWVSVFPENPRYGIRNVHGMILLSELEYGRTLSVMDGTHITNLRTAAVGAVACKHLAKKDASAIGFIGAGREARTHLDMISLVQPALQTCYVSSRSDATVQAFIEEEKKKHPDMEFVACGHDFEKAVCHADIIVTATSTQADLLKADWIQKGATYIHVGGWEDEFAVPKKANKIVCDEWECIKHRTQTISRMYKQGLLQDADIYADLQDIVCGDKPSRENQNEFIYFCSVGLAYIDVIFARYAYDYCLQNGIGQKFIF